MLQKLAKIFLFYKMRGKEDCLLNMANMPLGKEILKELIIYHYSIVCIIKTEPHIAINKIVFLIKSHIFEGLVLRLHQHQHFHNVE